MAFANRVSVELDTEARLTAALERIRAGCPLPWVVEVADAALCDREPQLVAGMAGWRPRRAKVHPGRHDVVALKP